MVLRSVPPDTAVGSQRMWHVTLTVAGRQLATDDVFDAFPRMSHLHPFLLEARYASDRAELRYWEEAEDMAAASAVASRMWRQLESSAGLPDWEVVGLQVLDRQTYLQREPLRSVPKAGWIAPF
ncbi:MAG: hypothetical protein ACO3YU_05260 [Candidatus Nanopelagicales bacterium]